MIYRTVIVVLVFCTIGHAADPAGVLSMVSGTVQIVRMGETRQARIADLILPGDRIVTSRQSEATFLFCPESRAAKILPEGEVQFEAATVRVLKGKLADDRKVPSCRLPGNLSLASASQLPNRLAPTASGTQWTVSLCATIRSRKPVTRTNQAGSAR